MTKSVETIDEVVNMTKNGHICYIIAFGPMCFFEKDVPLLLPESGNNINNKKGRVFLEPN